MRRRLTRDFTNIIRQNDAVLWIGEVDWVRIGPLVIMHGNRVGQNAAKQTMEDVGGQVSVGFGHTHKLSYAIRRGEDFTVQVWGSGCLCAYPHYNKRSRMRAKWQLGTAICYVDLNGREVNADNLVFEKERSRVWVRDGGKTGH